MKRIFTIVTGVILATAIFVSIGSAHAESAEDNSPISLSSNVINLNKTTEYFAFDQPFALSYADALYVHTESGAFRCGDKITKSEDATAYASVGGVTVILKDGKINGDADKDGYVRISAKDDRLYALKQNGDVDLYTRMLNEETGEYSLILTDSYPVSALAVAADEQGFCYLKKNNRTMYDIVLSNGKTVTCHSPVLTIATFGNSVYAVTYSGISVYNINDVFAEPSKIECEPLDIVCGDKPYILTYDQSISTIDGLKLKQIIASSGSEDYFFQMPCKGTTRLGKMYVTDSMLGRVAIYDKNGVTYKQNLNGATCVAADNDGKFYVAYDENKIACFDGNTRTEIKNPSNEKIIDIEAADTLYCLTESGDVYRGNTKIASNVSAFDYCSELVMLKDGKIRGYEVEADDFALDIAGNIFAIKDNLLTVISGEQKNTFVIDGALSLDSIMVSKIETPFVSYGDLIVSDKQNMRITSVARSLVGGADIKKLYTVQEIDDKALPKSDNLVSVTMTSSYLFTYPVESEITYSFTKGETAFVCHDVVSPDAYVYCIIENKNTGKLSQGYAYASAITSKEYSEPLKKEAKINSDNTGIYKYPSLSAHTVGKLNKGDMVAIMPFATNYEDEYGERWYTDISGNKWYRIDRDENEGYILASSANVNFFSDSEMPKANATVTDNTVLYMLSDGKYVPFDGAGLYIAKDTRVKIDTPFDTSRKYTKVVFYRDGYGTIDVDCYVLTKYVEYDGVDIVKIIAISVVALALVILLAILLRKKKTV